MASRKISDIAPVGTLNLTDKVPIGNGTGTAATATIQQIVDLAGGGEGSNVKVVNIADYCEEGSILPNDADLFIFRENGGLYSPLHYRSVAVAAEGNTRICVKLVFCTGYFHQRKGEYYIVFNLDEIGGIYTFECVYEGLGEDVPDYILEAFGEDGGGGGPVDGELSETSPNAIANSAVTKVILENEEVTANGFNAVRQILGTDEHLQYSFGGTTIGEAESIIDALELLDAAVANGGSGSGSGDGIEDAPSDGNAYVRKGGEWVPTIDFNDPSSFDLYVTDDESSYRGFYADSESVEVYTQWDTIKLNEDGATLNEKPIATVINIADYMTGGSKAGELMPPDADVYKYYDGGSAYECDVKVIESQGSQTFVACVQNLNVPAAIRRKYAVFSYVYNNDDDFGWSFITTQQGNTVDDAIKMAFHDDLIEKIGTTTSLTTTAKTDLVAAINELVTRVKSLEDALAAATNFDVQQY